MSAVHDDIAMKALAVQAEKIQKQFQEYIHEFKESSWYPDYFADKSMSKEKKDAIDTEADRFIYPDPPDAEWHAKLAEIARESHSYSDASPLPQTYLIAFYLNNAVESLKKGDLKAAVKFCGVYSHVIADTCEPIHAMSPALLDVVVPPPKEYLGLELHANVEGLKAPVDIAGYKPKLLGASAKQAEMGAFAGLMAAHRSGATLATPIVQALYADDVDEARRLSSLAQSEAARHFADFIFTVFSIADGATTPNESARDLREYPFVANSVDMLYRYQPIIDFSLAPYSGGKMKPLALRNSAGAVENVKGLGVVAFLGPPFADDTARIADIEYFVVPGAYETFSARVGLNPLFEESMLSARFAVLGDGAILAESPVSRPGEPAETITADIGGVGFLTLRMSYVDVPSTDELKKVSAHLAWVSHAVWAEPLLTP
jgi:hypothetical protein